MIREININFEARQAVVYPVEGDLARFIGDDFTQFDRVLPIVEASLIKSPEKIAAEKQAKIAQLDSEIAEKIAEKAELTKEEVKDE